MVVCDKAMLEYRIVITHLMHNYGCKILLAATIVRCKFNPRQQQSDNAFVFTSTRGPIRMKNVYIYSYMPFFWTLIMELKFLICFDNGNDNTFLTTVLSFFNTCYIQYLSII